MLAEQFYLDPPVAGLRLPYTLLKTSCSNDELKFCSTQPRAVTTICVDRTMQFAYSVLSMTFGLDIDGVLADFITPFLQLLEKRSGSGPIDPASVIDPNFTGHQIGRASCR